MPDVRALVIADNLLVRVGLAALLSSQEGIAVVGQIPGADRLIDDLDIYRPDLAVYDLGYDPLLPLPRVTALIEARMPVVALLPDAELAANIAAALINERAVSYALLPRDAEAGVLAAAVIAASCGLVAIEPSLAVSVLAASPPSQAPADALTPREFEVLQLLAEGLPNKQIAQRLQISPNTVKFHINAILSKLNAQSRTEAVVRATRLGLVIL